MVISTNLIERYMSKIPAEISESYGPLFRDMMTFHFVFIMSLATSNFVFSQILVFLKFTIRKENSEFDFPFYLIGIFVKEFTFFFSKN